MKATISIPAPLLREAAAAAKELRISRSELVRRALKEFLDRHRGAETTRRLNESYARHPAKVDPFLQRLATEAEAMKRMEWEE
jgi:Arc/MetJ-type ribon-helix-helix transcriptional regulator